MSIKESIVLGIPLLLMVLLGIPQLGLVGSLLFVMSTITFVAAVVLLAWILTKIYNKG